MNSHLFFECRGTGLKLHRLGSRPVFDRRSVGLELAGLCLVLSRYRRQLRCQVRNFGGRCFGDRSRFLAQLCDHRTASFARGVDILVKLINYGAAFHLRRLGDHAKLLDLSSGFGEFELRATDGVLLNRPLFLGQRVRKHRILLDRGLHLTLARPEPCYKLSLSGLLMLLELFNRHQRAVLVSLGPGPI